MKRNFKGIWIPADLYLDETLTWTQKLIIIEIDSFSKNGLDCFVSNEHLGQHCQLTKSAIEKALYSLVKAGIVFRERRKIGEKFRRILRLNRVNYGGTVPQQNTVADRNEVRHTNTSTKPSTKPKKEGRPATEGDCVEYFLELGSTQEEAFKFFDWFEQTGWKVKGGNQIEDWKATARNWNRRTKNDLDEKRTKGFSKGNFDANTLERFVAEG